MIDDLLLRAKWTLRAHSRTVVLTKKRNEKGTHVLMKAFLWALYLPEYPGATVEVRVGDRYKPDVVEVDPSGAPTFWGESGQVGKRKLESLFRRYRSTHFAVAKWATPIHPHRQLIERAAEAYRREAPVDLICFPDDSAERFIDRSGNITVGFEDVEWWRFEPS